MTLVMLLIAFIVRSTTQKEKAFPYPPRRIALAMQPGRNLVVYDNTCASGIYLGDGYC
jgi:ribosome maturation protein Sdo1